MVTTKKIIAALAVALMATLGTVAPAQAGDPVHTTGTGGGWCC